MRPRQPVPHEMHGTRSSQTIATLLDDSLRRDATTSGYDDEVRAVSRDRHEITPRSGQSELATWRIWHQGPWSDSSGRSSRAARPPGSPTGNCSSGSPRGQRAGEAAFAALVARHGPMVLGVCRQLLGDHQHAEDAFQAVFLVLARKARSIRDPDLLGNWLYGVALRTARHGPAPARPPTPDRGGRRHDASR